MLGYEAGRRNRLVASRLEKARVTGKCGAAELGKCGAACGVIGWLTCGGCAPSSPSWRALCARAKRRRVARTSSLKPSLAPQMLPPIESTGGCGFSSRFSSSHLQCGAGAVDLQPGWRRFDRRLASSARVRIPRLASTTRAPACVRNPLCSTRSLPRDVENPGSFNNGANRAAGQSGAVLDLGCRPNFGLFSDCTAVPRVPEARRLFSNFS